MFGNTYAEMGAGLSYIKRNESASDLLKKNINSVGVFESGLISLLHFC